MELEYATAYYHNQLVVGLVPWPSLPPVKCFFDCTQYAKMKGEDPVNLTKRSVAQMTSQILDAETHSHFSLQLQTVARETRRVPAERQVTHLSLLQI